MKLNRMPAYPIFVKDPYFSLWSNNEKINEEDLSFWHGEKKKIYGIIEVFGKEYSFLGNKENVDKLKQTMVEIDSFSTKYTFKNNDFVLKVEFVSPLLPDDLEIASCPVCYVNYSIKSNRRLNDVKVKLIAEERICYNTCKDEDACKEVRAGVCKDSFYQTAFIGLRTQAPLSHAGDEVGADWGYYYVAGENANTEIIDNRTFIIAQNNHTVNLDTVNGTLLLAFDDTCSIYYFGQWLNGYYFRNGKTIFDAIRYSFENKNKILKKCKKFDRRIVKDGKPFGKEYTFVLQASIRQIMGAHKIVETRDKRTLFLSKECNSDGCIATVDVTYPSFPFFKKYNPKLIKGMLYPIFDFVKSSIWSEKFAPHDVGVYPYCIGQVYAVQNTEALFYKNEGSIETLPYYYAMPSMNRIYDIEKQMPVEECANMLILTLFADDKKLVKQNYDILKTWADYLVDNGLIPSNQLCTDDFMGHVDKNANLAIKAIIGIKAFAYLAETMQDEYNKVRYIDIAKDYANKWLKLYVKNNHSLLSLNNQDTYSLKYNLAVDELIGERLFSKEFCESEANYYLTFANEYGIPLDSRLSYTKSDWLVWCASLSENLEVRKRYIEFITKFLLKTKDRVPFSDWYETKTANYVMFRNRSVQGGLFMFLLK